MPETENFSEAFSAGLDNDINESQEFPLEYPPPIQEAIKYELDMTSTGPCQKRVKVSIPREEIERFFDKEFTDLVRNAAIPGFRPGKTPRKLVERRFRRETSDQVRVRLLTLSLQHIATSGKIDVLTEPKMDIDTIKLPDEGDFVYEFDVEVAPTIKLPPYTGLSLRRPVRDYTQRDRELGIEEVRRDHAKVMPKDGPVVPGDQVTIELRIMAEKEVLNEFPDLTVDVVDALRFNDGVIENFAEALTGAQIDDFRDLPVKLNSQVAGIPKDTDLKAVVMVHEIHSVVLPPLDQNLFSALGLSKLEDLEESLVNRWNSVLAHRQLAFLDKQIVDYLLRDNDLELPPELLRAETELGTRQRVKKLLEAGFTEAQIDADANYIRQLSMSDAVETLRRRFVLKAVAAAEKIVCTQGDMEREILNLAEATGESPRRVRARCEKENLGEMIEQQVIETKCIQHIANMGKFEDFEEKLPDYPKHAMVDRFLIMNAP